MTITDNEKSLKEILKKERLYVLILAAIQVAHILDFVIMMPLGPRFMRVFSISPVEFSTLVSAYTFSAGIVGFTAALYADHFDRKNFLLFNFAGFILGTFLCAVSTNFTFLLVARVIAGAFGGIVNAAVLSLVADLIPFSRRGSAMGVVMSSFSISSIAGIPLGLYVANTFDWHWTFYLICFLGVIFWVMSLMILPSTESATVKRSLKDNLINFRSILTQKDYLLSFSFTSVLAFGVFTVIPFISAYMVQNVGLTELQLPYIYLIGGICTIIMARIIGKLSDRLGSYRMFATIAGISIIPIYIMTNLPQVPLVWALVVSSMFTMFGSTRFIPAMTLVSAVVKPQDRGTFMSLENAARQMSAGVASQLAGLIIGSGAAGELTNYHVVGYICILGTVFAILLARVLKTKFNLR
jgi:predicted MFS family arabinose efflux permease